MAEVIDDVASAPCPQGREDRCRLRRLLRAAAGRKLVADCSRYSAPEWRFEVRAQPSCVMAVYGGEPEDICACAISHARIHVLQLLELANDAEPLIAIVVNSVNRTLALALGAHRRGVVQVEAPRRPAWVPAAAQK